MFLIILPELLFVLKTFLQNNNFGEKSDFV
jgi:hypothetical protein